MKYTVLILFGKRHCSLPVALDIFTGVRGAAFVYFLLYAISLTHLTLHIWSYSQTRLKEAKKIHVIATQ
jgi:hypothetical protein